MLNKSVSDFIKQTASASPTPGGGSVAALVSSLAVALSSMTIALTLGKKNYESVQEEMLAYQNKLNLLQNETQNFVEKDIEAYNNIINQYSLPKNTDEEKEYRSIMIQKATIQAAYVPLNLAIKIFELYDIVEELLEKGNKNVYSDALISLILCHSAIESALCNVVVNKNCIKDIKIKDDLTKKIKEILNLSSERKNKLMELSHYFE